MFFNKKKQTRKPRITALSAKAQMRKIIYDSGCKFPEEVAIMMGLGTVSDDVAEMETEASERRIQRLDPILSIIETSALVAAQVSAMSFVRSEIEDGETPPGEEVIVALTQMFKIVSIASAISCMSTLIDLGLVMEGYDYDE